MGPPTSSPKGECVVPLFGSGGRYTLACERGGGGPNSDEGTDKVVYYTVYVCNLRLRFRMVVIRQHQISGNRHRKSIAESQMSKLTASAGYFLVECKLIISGTFKYIHLYSMTTFCRILNICFYSILMPVPISLKQCKYLVKYSINTHS